MSVNLKGKDRVWIVRAPAERRAFVRIFARIDAALKGAAASPRPVASWTHDRETKALTRSRRRAEAADEGDRRRLRLPGPFGRRAA